MYNENYVRTYNVCATYCALYVLKSFGLESPGREALNPGFSMKIATSYNRNY